MIDLPANQLSIVKAILRQHVPDNKVIAFGSRVENSAKKFSSLDIAIMADGKIPFQKMLELRDAFSESNLPITVDVIDFEQASPEFQKVIIGNHENLLNPHN